LTHDAECDARDGRRDERCCCEGGEFHGKRCFPSPALSASQPSRLAVLDVASLCHAARGMVVDRLMSAWLEPLREVQPRAASGAIRAGRGCDPCHARVLREYQRVSLTTRSSQAAATQAPTPVTVSASRSRTHSATAARTRWRAESVTCPARSGQRQAAPASRRAGREGPDYDLDISRAILQLNPHEYGSKSTKSVDTAGLAW
jgi:hypothetical protein